MTSAAEPSTRLGVELTQTAVATVVIMAAGIVTGLLAARILGPDGRGQLTASTIWPSTILYAGTFGLTEATAYFAGSKRSISDDIFVTAQIIALALGVALCAIGWMLLPVVLAQHSPLLQHQARFYLVLFAVPCLGSLSASAWLQGQGRMTAFNVSRVSVHVATAVAIAIAALIGRASVRGFMTAMLLGNMIGWLAACSAWFTHQANSGRFTWALVRPILSYGGRVQFGSWFAAANVRLDQLMLSAVAVPASLGIYVVAVSYSALVTTIPAAAAMVMLPRMIRDGADGVGGRTLATWYRRILWVTVLAAALLWLGAGFVLPLLFGEEFIGSVSLVSILVPASCVVGMNQVLATGFRGHGHPSIASRGEVIGLAATVPLLFFLLPRFGPPGAAITSLCAYTLTAAYLLHNARHLADDFRAFWVPTSADWDWLGRLAKSAGAFVTPA